MKWVFPLSLCALLGCALIAGVFFIFSVCIMRALGQLPPERGMAAMQSINVVILNPIFLTVFMGTAALSLLLLVLSFMRRSDPGARYLLAGSLLYLVGVLVVTAVVNVPLNDALAAAKPDDPGSLALWSKYQSQWTAWNHVRTVASILATLSFALALRSPQL